VTSRDNSGPPSPDSDKQAVSSTNHDDLEVSPGSEVTKEDLEKLEKLMKEYEKFLAASQRDSGPLEGFRPKTQYSDVVKPKKVSGNVEEESQESPSRSSQTSSSTRSGPRSSASASSKSQSPSQSSSSQSPQSQPKGTLTTAGGGTTAGTALPQPKVSDTTSPSSAASTTGEDAIPPTSEAPPGSATLGSIQPKRITLEEAKSLGIDVDSLKAPGEDSGTPSSSPSSYGAIWRSTRSEEQKRHEERMKRAAERDGRPDLGPYITKLRDFATNRKWWLIIGVLVCAPTVLTWWNSDQPTIRLPKGAGFEPRWERMDYVYLADSFTEGAIFEMCGLAAINALPPHNPITSPIDAIRGHISPIFPKGRQGVSAPTFWKLRIDFPAARETVWERNDDTLVPVQAASPTYKGSQFMWVLSRTWEDGEPVIRILTGRQVGGTIKANPKRNLVPWREPAFRPHRLGNPFLRPFEFDLMFRQLSPEHTVWFEALKKFTGIRHASDVLPDYDLSDYEYDMLEAKGYGDYIYDPDSVEWPQNNVIVVDPAGVLDEDEDIVQGLDLGEYAYEDESMNRYSPPYSAGYQREL